ncbi:MAG: hypothetical protein ACYCXN_06555 [Acidimicrobiales bacterium]
MSARDWEERVLAAEGAAERVGEIEQELLLASKLTGSSSTTRGKQAPAPSPTAADRRVLPAHYDRFYRSARLP